MRPPNRDVITAYIPGGPVTSALVKITHTPNLLTSKKQEITPDTSVTGRVLAVNQNNCASAVINQTAAPHVHPRAPSWKRVGLPRLRHGSLLHILYGAKPVGWLSY